MPEEFVDDPEIKFKGENDKVKLPWYRRIPKYGIVRVALIQYINTATWIPQVLKPILTAGASQIEYEKNNGPEFKR